MPPTLNTFEPDDCCAKAMRKLDLAILEFWFCPKCGCRWEPTMIGEIRHWTPREILEVFRR